MITGSQLRAARGLLNMSVIELAEASGLAINTIRRAEGTNGIPQVTAANITLLRTLLEKAGVVFIDAGELGPGVRLENSIPLPVQPRRRG